MATDLIELRRRWQYARDVVYGTADRFGECGACHAAGRALWNDKDCLFPLAACRECWDKLEAKLRERCRKELPEHCRPKKRSW